MKKTRIVWAIAFGSMLAVTGCGDDSGPSDGSGGSGGSNGSGFCETLCNVCNAGAAADCSSACDSVLGGLPGGIDFESCPGELDAVASCFGANDCDSTMCDAEQNAWISCVAGSFF